MDPGPYCLRQFWVTENMSGRATAGPAWRVRAGTWGGGEEGIWGLNVCMCICVHLWCLCENPWVWEVDLDLGLSGVQ